MAKGQEVQFQEIEIGGWMIWRSWDQIILPVFMRSKFLIIIWSPDYGVLHKIKIKKGLLGNFHLMINLLATSTIMRSKFANNAFFNFDLMINLLATSGIMRWKLFKFVKLHLWLIFSPNFEPSVHKNFQSHDCTCG